jgi:uracil-DNA glycosylase family 4
MSVKRFSQFKKEYRAAIAQRFGEENIGTFWGNPHAKIGHISQAPSLSVIRNKRPFSDKSGERLRDEWYQISYDEFYDPDNFYITAVGMYYPGKNEKGGDNKPSYEFAKKWLPGELELIDPEFFIVVGGVAAGFFFPGERLTDLVWEDRKISGKTAYVLPHPSPINVKWFMDNPQFEKERIQEIRKRIHDTIR